MHRFRWSINLLFWEPHLYLRLHGNLVPLSKATLHLRVRIGLRGKTINLLLFKANAIIKENSVCVAPFKKERLCVIFNIVNFDRKSSVIAPARD
jgi:hypothetical protein